MKRRISQWLTNNFANAISIAALLLSGFALYFQFFYESSETYVSISRPEWSIAEGRFGKGPLLGFVGIFVNVGNKPIVVENVTLSAEPTSSELSDAACILSKGNLGLEWNRSFDGKNVSRAIAVALTGGQVLTGFWDFEPLPNMIRDAPECQSSKGEYSVALEFDTIDHAGNRKSTEFLLGRLVYTAKRIYLFEGTPNTRRLIKISN
ncbi:hypothetical protein [Parvibaculum sp.]|uniref:hypothetical protein n=1 Tax=Parvibaculum sp. TaxID=2024848 RepID=UPI002BF59EA0|nr:hypothetical protein [Parvibaculum sp.]HUD52740.1 hypothetical protein [Parvibaculum sp.]